MVCTMHIIILNYQRASLKGLLLCTWGWLLCAMRGLLVRLRACKYIIPKAGTSCIVVWDWVTYHWDSVLLMRVKQREVGYSRNIVSCTNESDCCECMVIQVHNNFTNTYQWCPNIKHTMGWAGSFCNRLCMVEKWYVRRGSHTMSAYILHGHLTSGLVSLMWATGWDVLVAVYKVIES